MTASRTWLEQLSDISRQPNPVADPVALPSVFADEHSKQPEVMYPGLATAGFNHCSVRFFNLTGDPKAAPRHVEDLSNDELDHVLQVQRDHGIQTTSLGGRIGKVRFTGQGDEVLVKKDGEFQPTPFEEYLKYCERCFEITERLGTKLYRLFPFYAPEGAKNDDWLGAASDALGRIVELAGKHGLILGVETEANLIAPDGHCLAKVVSELNRPNLGIVFDAGNMRTMGYSAAQIVAQFMAALPHLIWFHIKDYNGPVPDQVGGHIEEDLLKHFVPCDIGDSGHVEIFRLLRKALPALHQKMDDLALDGFFLELEPHVRGGGQFGGYSGPDGIGIALRALSDLCRFTGIQLPLRHFDDVLRDRGLLG